MILANSNIHGLLTPDSVYDKIPHTIFPRTLIRIVIQYGHTYYDMLVKEGAPVAQILILKFEKG